MTDKALVTIFREIPALTLEHPDIAELSKKVKLLCNGSEYERKAVEHFFEKASRNAMSRVIHDLDPNEIDALTPRLKKRALDESAKELRVLGEKDAETSMSEVSKSYPEGFKAFVENREHEIETTVTQWVDKRFDLAKAYCERLETLCGQAINTMFSVWEKRLEQPNGVIDTKMREELENNSESVVKAVLAKTNDVLRWSDLEKEVEK